MWTLEIMPPTLAANGERASPNGGRRFRRMAAGAVAGMLYAVSTGCASSGAVPRPFPGAPAGGGETSQESAGSVARPPSESLAYAVTGTALGLTGVPYRNGGNDPRGFDCSGFIWFVFAQHGIEVPRTVTDLFASGRPVAVDELQPGDLVFFSTIAPGASHVGMSIGGDQFVHAPSSKGEVRTERVSAPYWRSRFVGARRLAQVAGTSGAALRPRGAHPSASSVALSIR